MFALKKHDCDKEREIGIMTANIENINKNVDEIKTTMNNFIKSANKTYATKEEVKSSIKLLKEDNTRQDKEIDWSKNKIVTLIKDVGMIGAIVFISYKQYGLP